MTESLVACLTKNPTTEEATLAEQCGLHTGTSVPFWMLARVALRGDETAAKANATGRWIATRRSFERRMRRLAAASALALLGSLGTWAVSALSRAHDAGIEQERVAQLSHRIDDLGRQIEAIQQVMLRKSGIDPLAPSGSFDIDGNVIHDKMSLIIRTPDLCSVTQ